MEENKLLEKLWSEAESVDVPPELEPEQIRMRIEAVKQESAGKDSEDKREKQTAKKRGFSWHGYGSRVAAAAIVLVASLGAFSVANSQGIAPLKEEMQISDLETGQTLEGAEDTREQDAQTGQQDGAANQSEAKLVKNLGDYHLVESYEEVVEMINRLSADRMYLYGDGAVNDFAVDGVMMKEEAAAESSADTPASSSMQDTAANKQDQAWTESMDFSTTNLQVTGVDESDIVKTDGHYIYIATGDKVQIVDASTDTPRQLGSITPEFSGNMDRIREMYVSEGRLLLIVQTEDTDGLELAEDDMYAKEKMMVDMAYNPGRANSVHTQVLTYDITSPAGAKLIGTFTQDGMYHTSRKIGDQLYLFTDYGYPVIYPYYRTFLDGRANLEQQKEDWEAGVTQEDVKNELPKIQGETIPENCIYLPKDSTEQGVLIATMNVKEPEKATDQKLIFCGYSTLYVTKDSILLYCTDYDPAADRGRTKLTRFAIGDGRITADCAEAVPGYIEDTFAIHENKDGYVYVLTTDYTANGTTNQLFVLDSRLKIHGKIEHIADGETVYAARFVDDIGYFVTYRNMDPLFTVDFSDPANPKLIGELEIPGFSDYLQFWDDTHLIGVGEERKAEGSEFVGIKVSLYDISDPKNVKESAKLVMDDACYAPAQYNYKALLADSKKNVIAFLTQDKGDTYQLSQRIFTVDDGALKKVATDKIAGTDAALEDAGMYVSADEFRNLYIGDKMYLVREGLILVYDMSKDFERAAVCKLK